MTTKPVDERIRLTEEESAGMRDFFEVLDGHREEARSAVLAVVERLPILARVVSRLDPEAEEAQRRRNDALQKAALLDGEWTPYLDELRALGASYADQGIPFADWFELVHAFRAGLMPRVVERFGTDVPRLNGAIAGMQRFLDVALEALAQAYLERKESALRRHVRELERSNRELDDFAYVASHDLRAPLRDISNLAGWIVEDVGDGLPAESARHLELLQSRVGRMERLLDDLLRYSRAGREATRPEEVDTAALVADVAALLCADGRFRVDVAGEMPVVETPRAPLEQVFLNLVGNAIKHHDREEGRITVAGTVEGCFAEFTVTDDGPGIESEFGDRVFHMFQTLRPRDEREGSGMGLALVKKLVEANEGKIRLEPAGDEGGRGARFRFSWPLRWSREEPGEKAPGEKALGEST
ncbi:MAG: sensor histidine kinase [Myxococcota bacterium]